MGEEDSCAVGATLPRPSSEVVEAGPSFRCAVGHFVEAEEADACLGVVSWAAGAGGHSLVPCPQLGRQRHVVVPEGPCPGSLASLACIYPLVLD